MNLIEQLGGHENAKRFLVDILDNKTPCEILTRELLEYRRQHNIFEVGDLITHPVFWGLFQVKETMKHHVLGITPTGYESKLSMELIRHATDEEIKTGRRL